MRCRAAAWAGPQVYRVMAGAAGRRCRGAQPAAAAAAAAAGVPAARWRQAPGQGWRKMCAASLAVAATVAFGAVALTEQALRPAGPQAHLGALVFSGSPGSAAALQGRWADLLALLVLGLAVTMRRWPPAVARKRPLRDAAAGPAAASSANAARWRCWCWWCSTSWAMRLRVSLVTPFLLDRCALRGRRGGRRQQGDRAVAHDRRCAAGRRGDAAAGPVARAAALRRAAGPPATWAIGGWRWAGKRHAWAACCCRPSTGAS